MTVSVMAGLAAFNRASQAELTPRLLGCLAVPRWAAEVAAGRPYPALETLREQASAAALAMTAAELDAALARHPRIGERARDGEHDAELSRREQAGVDPDDADVAARLTAGNAAYEARFDRVFLIRAAGRSAAEILAELERRLGNDDDAERAETIDQLGQIAVLRLDDVVANLSAPSRDEE
jgi:2-oxo-4-hydroxy-4-carboxy-5-ureidoimidazoline decarboxylase